MSDHLLATQRRFFGALTEPLFGENRARAELPPAPGAAAPSVAFLATADALLRSTPAVPAEERLGLYQRQYWYRLIDSLAEDFPRVRRLLGREAFYSALERHLQACPPATYTLRTLGAGFAAWVARDTATPTSLRPWAAALAALDYAHLGAFEAADAPVAGEDDFAVHPLRLHPSVQLVPVERPLARWLALAADTPESDAPLSPPDDAGAARELHVVWRTPDHRLRETREPRSLLALLSELRVGGPLADLIERTHPLPAPAVIQDAFARWRARHWLTTHHPAPARGAGM